MKWLPKSLFKNLLIEYVSRNFPSEKYIEEESIIFYLYVPRAYQEVFELKEEGWFYFYVDSTGPLKIQELQQLTISGLTNDKAPGVDKIRVEMPKAG